MINSKTLLSPQELKAMLPLSTELFELKTRFDNEIKKCILGEKFLVVTGPCSADNIDAVLQYARRIEQLQQKVKDKILIVLRVYTAKPRTDGEGYLGILFHKNAKDIADIQTGLIDARKMMLSCLEIGLPIADELLYPDTIDYYGDLISYITLGARSSMDALHRGIASGLDIAVGVKNSIDGDLLAMAKGVYAVSKPKTFLYNHCEVSTNGNRYAHGILRGYHDGRQFNSNINCSSKVQEYYKQLGIAHSFVLVDCSHANSAKVASVQLDNALTAVNDRSVGGIMLESYLFSGTSNDSFGVSKTDECIDLESTEKLILDIYEILKNR